MTHHSDAAAQCFVPGRTLTIPRGYSSKSVVERGPLVVRMVWDQLCDAHNNVPANAEMFNKSTVAISERELLQKLSNAMRLVKIVSPVSAQRAIALSRRDAEMEINSKFAIHN
ncbi:hypothetical protein Aduo_017710 [Ancylostoma duodenale]